MKRRFSAALILILLCLVFAAEFFGESRKSHDQQAPRDKEGAQRLQPAGFATNLKTLVKRLRAGGASVKLGEKISQPFFSVAGRMLIVDGEQVQVFEYGTAAKARAESRTISADGSAVGTTMVTWVGPPHFFMNGKMIVLYAGENPPVINALEKALGKQFAGK